MSLPEVSPSEAARGVDAQLFEIEREIDWLKRVSPLGNTARWEAFERSGYVEAEPLTYPHFDLDVSDVRARLGRLPMAEIRQPVYRVLLEEKKTELEQLTTLLESRDTLAFAAASVGLFGGTDPDLLAVARTILATVPATEAMSDLVGADAVVAEAEAARNRYARQAADFYFRIKLVDDADASLLVHNGDLVVDRHLRVERSRVAPLIAHEVGVHVLTRYNGGRQPLRLFESGFAHYDVLQEGLATFCEYLAGNLPASRLRVLAARVVAADLVVGHQPIEAIFGVLHDEFELNAEWAFEVAVRAKRGGGLTKDAVYLAGLRDVLAWLADGGDISQLFLGKYSLRQRHLVAELLDERLLSPPALLPICLTDEQGGARLSDALSVPITAFYHSEHAI